MIILPFDQAAADWYAKERARLQRQGNPCAYSDGEIAAIAVTQNLMLVTRNTQDFENFQNLALENGLNNLVISYSKAFQKRAGILKIEPFNITKSPNR